MVDTLQAYMVAAIAIEGLVSWGQTIFVDKKFQWQILVSLGLSFHTEYGGTKEATRFPRKN